MKRIILEPHGYRIIDKRFTDKLASFRKSQTSKEFYLIVMLPGSNNAIQDRLADLGASKDDICDELYRLESKSIIKRDKREFGVPTAMGGMPFGFKYEGIKHKLILYIEKTLITKSVYMPFTGLEKY